MITATPTILPHHTRDDGSCPVKIRISSNRTSAYLPTNIIASKKEISGGKLKAGTAAVNGLSGLLQDVRKLISEIPFAEAQEMSASQVAEYIKRRIKDKDGFSLDFIAYMRKLADTKSEGSAACYRTAANALARYVGSEQLDISQITARFLRGFEAFLREEPNVSKKKKKDAKGNPLPVKMPVRKFSQYLGSVRHAHNKARQEFNEPDIGIIRIPYSPFDYYKVPAQNPPKHRNKSIEIIQKMIDAHRSLKGRERLGVDVFLIDFVLMGMNVPDIYDAAEPEDGVITYHRRKTYKKRLDGAEVRVRIEDCVKPLIDDYAGSNGYAFNLRERYSHFNSVTRNANIGLKSWCESVGLKPFTMYSARHSWGTIANSSKGGIDKATVNDSLCHVDPDMKVTDIYVEKDWEVIWDANKKVLSLFDWSKV